MTYPPNRMGGNMSLAGVGAAYGRLFPHLWFSQPVTIPGEPTLNEARYRTHNVDVQGGPKDWSRRFPWRAPGSAPVRGSGCGVAGGFHLPIPNGGAVPPGRKFGEDGLVLPENEPAHWSKGEVVNVSWSFVANHGGGYSWRLCKKGGEITEECFQRTVLSFHGTKSRIVYSDRLPNRHGYLKLPTFEVPRTVVAEGTHPLGSQWARNPIPSCLYCDQSQCGSNLPNVSEWFQPDQSDGSWQVGGKAWWETEKCAQDCSGAGMMQCPPGMTQFREPLPGLSSYLGPFLFDFQSKTPVTVGFEGVPYNIMDEVVIPTDLDAGDYLLSFRWDCEQSPQIWQSCADVKILEPAVVV